MTEDAAKEWSMQIEGLDHLVLTVGDLGRTRDIYERVLSMEAVVFGEGRHTLAFGAQKINLHEVGREFEPKAAGLSQARPTFASSRTRRWRRSSNT